MRLELMALNTYPYKAEEMVENKFKQQHIFHELIT